MLYLLVTQLGWLAFAILLIVVVGLYTRIKRQIWQLRYDMTKLQAELEQQKSSHQSSKPTQNADQYTDAAHIVTEQQSTDPHTQSLTQSLAKPHDVDDTAVHSQLPPPLPDSAPVAPASKTSTPFAFKDSSTSTKDPAATVKPHRAPTPIEPDERSLPIVTSLIHSIKNWFFGGNLVVRVGVLVLLIGVVLLLRLLSDYIEVPITTKLIAIGIAGLGLAGLGFKLTAKRFSYGITLQGAGLAIAYLSTFFAYSVYQVMASLPSFIGLGLLSAMTIVLAIRQNAFPLALLALSGGFFAPILTSEDTGGLVVLFSYYLLLNVTIAVIAHYRPWKILNLFGVVVTFGLAYYWGISDDLRVVITSQRWSLVILVTLHWLLYLFVVVRYAQQIITYNTFNEKERRHTDSTNDLSPVDKTHTGNQTYLFPIDTGLLFSVPLLSFGLFSALLDDIPNALTMTSAILAVVYLGLGWLFVQRSQYYALITEGMLALGFGFLALVIPLALDAEWIAFGWSIQGLALVWFGRRSLRAWSVFFGLLLQLISIGMLMTTAIFSSSYTILAFSVSALSYLATAFVLRASNSPSIIISKLDGNISNSPTASTLRQQTLGQRQALDHTSDTFRSYARALGVDTQAAQQWLSSVDDQSRMFRFIWQSPRMIMFLTSTAMIWALHVLVLDLRHWFTIWQLATTTIALAALISLGVYWAVNRYQPWTEIRQLSRGLLLLFCLMLVLQLPQKFELGLTWMTTEWLVFLSLIIGWLVIGQLWLKAWTDNHHSSRGTKTSWLATGLLLIAAAAHYELPDSDGNMAVLITAALILIGLWFSHKKLGHRATQAADRTISKQGLLYWFDWQRALWGCAVLFSPVALLWMLLTNWSYDGEVWGLAYFPLLNLYDLASWLTLLVGFSLYYLSQRRHNESIIEPSAAAKSKYAPTAEYLLIALGLISFWLVSSMLIRTLHAFIGTPLWNDYQGGAWQSEQVQTGLTILWTLLALVATIIASRYWQRALWFMGIGLLGIVVLKLVLVDLSQTEAIWRVISFLGAGSLILLIGYLAPLPLAHDEITDKD